MFKALDARGVQYSVLQLGRDGNILQHQQTRLRKKITLDLESFPEADFFLSFELLQLYGAKYIETVAYNLDFPIDIGKAVEHLTEDTNAKYIQEHKGVTDTDRLVALAIKESKIDLTKLYEADPPAPSKPEVVKSKAPSKRALKKAQAAEVPKPTKARQEADKRREARLARVAEEEAAALKKEKNAARAKKAAATRAKNKRAKAKAAKDAKNSK